MAGLVPAIHVFDSAKKGRRGCPAQGRAWRDCGMANHGSLSDPILWL